MDDLSKLSDDELDKIIAKGAVEKKHGPDLSSLSDDELDKIISHEVAGPGLGEKFLNGVSAVGKTIDTYTGAPARAGLNELIRTQPEFGKDRPSLFGNIMSAGKAYVGQFGKDPGLAPTGADIAEKRLGLDNKTRTEIPQYKFAGELSAKERATMKPDAQGRYLVGSTKSATPAEAAGLGIDVLADPTNIIPIGTIAKGAGKTTEAALKLGVKGAEALPGVKAGKAAAGRIIEDFIKPTRSADFNELAQIADKHAIDLTKAPEAVEFGKSSVISRLGRSQAEGPAGQPKLEAYRGYLGDVSNALNNELTKGSGVAPMSRVDAGLHLKDAYNKSVSKLFDEADTGYTYFVDTYPGLKLSKEASADVASKLNGVEKFAKGRIARGLSPAQVAQGNMLLNATSAIRRTNGSFKQTVEALRDIGEIAYSKQIIGQIPPDIAKTRELYSTLRESLIKTVETDVKDGTALAGALKISNDKITNFLKDSEFIDNVISHAEAPEQIFDRISKNTAQIDSLRKTLSPEDFAAFRGAYVENLIKRDESGIIRFPTLRNTLENKQNKEVLKKLFEQEPEQLKDLLDVVKLGQAAGVDVLSTSGTGGAIKFGDLKNGVTNAITNEATLDSLKNSARKRSLKLPQAAAPAPQRNLFGPGAISLPEAAGLRLPQQISIQQRNRERNP